MWKLKISKYFYKIYLKNLIQMSFFFFHQKHQAVPFHVEIVDTLESESFELITVNSVHIHKLSLSLKHKFNMNCELYFVNCWAFLTCFSVIYLCKCICSSPLLFLCWQFHTDRATSWYIQIIGQNIGNRIIFSTNIGIGNELLFIPENYISARLWYEHGHETTEK